MKTAGQRGSSKPPAKRTDPNQPHGGKGSNQYATKGIGKTKPVAENKPKRSADPAADASPRTKSEIAKASATRVDAPIQRYCEEVNEPILAKLMGGSSIADNQPVDVVLFAGNVKPPSGPLSDADYKSLVAKHGVAHGIEMKTIVSNKANKLTMKRSAMDLKKAWERKHKAPVHTIVFDDSKVFNANGDGKHDITQRKIYYRRGYGSFRIDGMHQVTSAAELKALLTTPKRSLPKGAK